MHELRGNYRYVSVYAIVFYQAYFGTSVDYMHSANNCFAGMSAINLLAPPANFHAMDNIIES